MIFRLFCRSQGARLFEVEAKLFGKNTCGQLHFLNVFFSFFPFPWRGTGPKALDGGLAKFDGHMFFRMCLIKKLCFS